MSLTRALSTAYSGLTASGLRADISSQNIANATTPGYSKRTVTTTDRIGNQIGDGLGITKVTRAQDLALSRIRRQADGATAKSTVVAGAYQAINSEIGLPGDNYGLFSAVETLQSSLDDLIATPESEALQGATIDAFDEVSRTLNSLSGIAQSLRQTSDGNIARDVSTVNAAINRLQEINRDYTSYNEASGNVSALEDERQRLIDQISEIIPIKDIPRDKGRVDIITQSGVFLISDNHVSELSFQVAPQITAQTRFDSGSISLSGLKIGDVDVTPGTQSRHAIFQGALAGHFAIRDTIAPDFSDQLDAVASDLISRTSAAFIDPTTSTGAAGILTDNGNALDPSSTRGLAGRISLNSALDPYDANTNFRIRDGLNSTHPGPAGRTDILKNLQTTLTDITPAPTGSNLTGSYSAAGLIAELSSNIGQKTLRADSVLVSETAHQTILSDADLAQSAVDMDAELQQLLVIEQSYAANARVIQSIADMLDQILQL